MPLESCFESETSKGYGKGEKYSKYTVYPEETHHMSSPHYPLHITIGSVKAESWNELCFLSFCFIIYDATMRFPSLAFLSLLTRWTSEHCTKCWIGSLRKSGLDGSESEWYHDSLRILPYVVVQIQLYTQLYTNFTTLPCRVWQSALSENSGLFVPTHKRGIFPLDLCVYLSHFQSRD